VQANWSKYWKFVTHWKLNIKWSPSNFLIMETFLILIKSGE